MRARIVVVPLMLAVVAGCGSGAGAGAAADHAPRAAARHFLDRYVTRGGRVVRRDQGGDTVSEGQAYGLLLAAATGDHARFARIWRWTRRELLRPDGLLAWRWAHGRVRDRQPAADADLDAARALVLAGRRFHRPRLRRAGARTAVAILRADRGRGRLVAGPWARRERVVNPSYWSPRAAAALAGGGHAGAWRALGRRALRDTRRLLAGPHLPSDWARAAQGGLRPTAPPGGGRIRYGYDAARLPIRLAEACGAGWRRLANSLWPLLREHSDALPRRLGGAPAGHGRHPVALVAAAAAAGAGGDATARAQLLDRAQALDRAAPSYYGAAWVALGRVMLTTHALGRCG